MASCSLLPERLLSASSDFCSRLCRLCALSPVCKIVDNYCMNGIPIRLDAEYFIIELDGSGFCSVHLEHGYLCHVVSSFPAARLFVLTFDGIANSYEASSAARNRTLDEQQIPVGVDLNKFDVLYCNGIASHSSRRLVALEDSGRICRGGECAMQSLLNENISEETGRYDELIHSLGGIDMQLLGIGVNGHIGFNEPADEFSLGTHMVYLTSSTIDANKRFFDSIEQVPQKAYTMGTREILQSHTVVLIASGRNKALAVKNSFFGPVTPTIPASILQLHGPPGGTDPG